MWAARSQEVFDRFARKTGVKFPEQARGWPTLDRAGLPEEEKAVGVWNETRSARLRAPAIQILWSRRRVQLLWTKSCLWMTSMSATCWRIINCRRRLMSRISLRSTSLRSWQLRGAKNARSSIVFNVHDSSERPRNLGAPSRSRLRNSSPINRMLADAYFTKDAGDPMDLLRSCLRRKRYFNIKLWRSMRGCHGSKYMKKLITSP